MPDFITFPYDREKAINYAVYWAYRRNPNYLDFQDLGGDCTNFVSQCLYAGSGVMNYTPTYGWFYITSNDRTASWTGVEYLYEFLIGNRGTGPFGSDASLNLLQKGDIVQLGEKSGQFYHSLIAIEVPENPTLDNVLVAAHSKDSSCRPISTYEIKEIRFIHIDGVRTLPSDTVVQDSNDIRQGNNPSQSLSPLPPSSIDPNWIPRPGTNPAPPSSNGLFYEEEPGEEEQPETAAPAPTPAPMSAPETGNRPYIPFGRNRYLPF